MNTVHELLAFALGGGVIGYATGRAHQWLAARAGSRRKAQLTSPNRPLRGAHRKQPAS